MSEVLFHPACRILTLDSLIESVFLFVSEVVLVSKYKTSFNLLKMVLDDDSPMAAVRATRATTSNVKNDTA